MSLKLPLRENSHEELVQAYADQRVRWGEARTIINDAYEAMQNLVNNCTEFNDGDFDEVRTVIAKIEAAS